MQFIDLRHIDQKLDRMISMLTQILNKETTIMAALDDLTAQVTATVGVEASAVKLIQGIAAQLAAAIAAGNPAALTALQTQLNTSATALAAAVAANTPPVTP